MKLAPRRLAAVATAVLILAGVVVLSSPVSADRYPQVTLTSGQQFHYRSTRPTMGSSSGVLTVLGNPAQCASPPYSATCDSFKLVLDLDESPEAFNFVTLRLAWEARATPPLALAVAGLSSLQVVDYNMYVWEEGRSETGATTYARRTDISGGLGNPELIGFVAQRPDYWVTIQHAQGPSLGYEFTAFYSNERFSSPFEVLDPAFSGSGGSFNQPPPADLSADPPAQAAPAFAPEPSLVDAPGADGAVVVRDFQPIAPDSDFAGFRGNVDNTLAGLSGVAAATQRAPAIVDPPPLAIALFWLLALPLATVFLIAAWARRRRPAALSA